MLQAPRRVVPSRHLQVARVSPKKARRERKRSSVLLEKTSFSSGDSNTQALGDAGPFPPRRVFTDLHALTGSGAPGWAPGSRFGPAEGSVWWCRSHEVRSLPAPLISTTRPAAGWGAMCVLGFKHRSCSGLLPCSLAYAAEGIPTRMWACCYFIPRAASSFNTVLLRHLSDENHCMVTLLEVQTRRVRS